MPYKRKKIGEASNRRGPLSKKEKDVIVQYITEKSTKEIASILKRKAQQIEDFKKVYLANAPVVTVAKTEAEEYKRELYNHPSWTSLQKQFTKDELIFFENDYVEYRKQFKDMTATETKQLHQMITLDIFMARLNVEKIQYKEEISRIEKILKREYSKDPALLMPDEMQHLNNLENQLKGMRAGSSSQAKEYNEFLQKHKELMKELKGTREQRMKHIEDEGRFMAILKRLELEESRSNFGEVLGLMDLAIQAEKQRLAIPHKYMDSSIDQPLLNAETIINYSEEDV